MIFSTHHSIRMDHPGNAPCMNCFRSSTLRVHPPCQSVLGWVEVEMRVRMYGPVFTHPVESVLGWDEVETRVRRYAPVFTHPVNLY
jgi:hypothetical protein